MSNDIQSSKQKKVVIVGLPNTGKTQMFNNLTGEYSLVSNTLLTTIKVKRILCLLNDQLYEVIDTPGLYSMQTEPCAPQMGLNMSILGRMGTSAFLIAFTVLTFGEIAAGLILNRVLKEEKMSAFIQELPPIRLPNVKAVLVKT
ncbi:MAG: 50S ribosome-binding GTPase [Deltaproteobacteria bacterium]|nr:50S ribosome-binding GTPase [Deltaproteobacteria bacterium]